MEQIQFIGENEDIVRVSLELGDVDHIDTASEEITDEFLLFGIKSGLLNQWAESFPDPRKNPQIKMEVLLTAAIAARFAKQYALRQSGYVLQSARVLGALGYSVKVTEPGEGLSVRGTSDNAPYSGDVWRKLLVKMEKVADKEKFKERAKELMALKQQVRVRERKSRREAKEEFDKVDALANSLCAVSLLENWYNQKVGPVLLQYAELGTGRRIHLLDATKIEVGFETATYEASAVVKDEDGEYKRGYKISTLRTLLDAAGVITQLVFGPISCHDVQLSREMVMNSAVLRAGDLLIEDRGFVDGELISYLKKEKQVDVIVPLKKSMHSYKEAVAIAHMQGVWKKHPLRENQEIAFVENLEHVWDQCEVALNGCVIRFYNEYEKRVDYIVIVTTDQSLSAEWIVRHYSQRPEIEQDYQQLKSGGWMLETLSSTRYSEIVWSVMSVMLSFNLYQMFANTKAGSQFAGKTRRSIELEQLKDHKTYVIVYSKGYFAIYETFEFVQIILHLSQDVQARLRTWFTLHLSKLKKE